MSNRVIVRFHLRSQTAGSYMIREMSEEEARIIVTSWLNNSEDNRVGCSSLPGTSTVWGIDMNEVVFVDLIPVEEHRRLLEDQIRQQQAQQQQPILGRSGGKW